MAARLVPKGRGFRLLLLMICLVADVVNYSPLDPRKKLFQIMIVSIGMQAFLLKRLEEYNLPPRFFYSSTNLCLVNIKRYECFLMVAWLIVRISCIHPLLLWARFNTRSIFKRSKTSLNSAFLTMAKEPNMFYYLLITGGKTNLFISFPLLLRRRETQTISSRI